MYLGVYAYALVFGRASTLLEYNRTHMYVLADSLFRY